MSFGHPDFSLVRETIVAAGGTTALRAGVLYECDMNADVETVTLPPVADNLGRAIGILYRTGNNLTIQPDGTDTMAEGRPGSGLATPLVIAPQRDWIGYFVAQTDGASDSWVLVSEPVLDGEWAAPYRATGTGFSRVLRAGGTADVVNGGDMSVLGGQGFNGGDAILGGGQPNGGAEGRARLQGLLAISEAPHTMQEQVSLQDVGTRPTATSDVQVYGDDVSGVLEGFALNSADRQRPLGRVADLVLDPLGTDDGYVYTTWDGVVTAALALGVEVGIYVANDVVVASGTYSDPNMRRLRFFGDFADAIFLTHTQIEFTGTAIMTQWPASFDYLALDMGAASTVSPFTVDGTSGGIQTTEFNLCSGATAIGAAPAFDIGFAGFSGFLLSHGCTFTVGDATSPYVDITVATGAFFLGASESPDSAIAGSTSIPSNWIRTPVGGSTFSTVWNEPANTLASSTQSLLDASTTLGRQLPTALGRTQFSNSGGADTVDWHNAELSFPFVGGSFTIDLGFPFPTIGPEAWFEVGSFGGGQHTINLGTGMSFDAPGRIVFGSDTTRVIESHDTRWRMVKSGGASWLLLSPWGAEESQVGPTYVRDVEATNNSTVAMHDARTVPDNMVMTVTGKVWARGATGPVGAMFTIDAAYRRTGGVVTLIGDTSATVGNDMGGGGVALVIAGTTVRVDVTSPAGAGATAWSCLLEYREIES